MLESTVNMDILARKLLVVSLLTFFILELVYNAQCLIVFSIIILSGMNHEDMGDKWDLVVEDSSVDTLAILIYDRPVCSS